MMRYCTVLTRGLCAGVLLLLISCATPVEEAPLPTEEEAAALAAAEEALPPPIPDEVLLAHAQAIQALQEKDYAAAFARLDPLVEQYPLYPGLQLNRAIAQFNLDAVDDAAASFERILDTWPDHPVATTYLGVMKRREGNFAAAREWYERALSADETYSFAHLNLGILCDLYLQDLACAHQHYLRYEVLAGSVDKRFKGWKIDLERRMKKKGMLK